MSHFLVSSEYIKDLVWSGTLSFTGPVTSQVLLLLFFTVSVDASMTPDLKIFSPKLIQQLRVAYFCLNPERVGEPGLYLSVSARRPRHF